MQISKLIILIAYFYMTIMATGCRIQNDPVRFADKVEGLAIHSTREEVFQFLGEPIDKYVNPRTGFEEWHYLDKPVQPRGYSGSGGIVVLFKDDKFIEWQDIRVNVR